MKLRKLENEMPAVTLDFYNSKQLDPRITFTRASFAPATDPGSGTGIAGGQYNMFNVNVPRLTDQGLLIEEPRTNRWTNSQVFSSGWTPNDMGTPTDNAAIAPDGTNTAASVFETATTNTHYIISNQVVPNSFAALSWSIFVKANGRDYVIFHLLQRFNVVGFYTACIDLKTGEITKELDSSAGGANHWYNFTRKVTPYGNGWYRIEVGYQGQNVNGTEAYIYGATGPDPTFGGAASAIPTDTYPGDPTKGYYLWGFQVEDDTFATSYIPTNGSEVTRAADVCVFNDSNVLGASSGTYVVDATLFADPGFNMNNQYVFITQAATDASSVSITAGVGYSVQILDSGSFNGRVDYKAWTTGVKGIAAVAYAPGPSGSGGADVVYASDGEIRGTNVITTGGSTTPTNMYQMFLFRAANGAANTLSTGYLHRLAFYPTRLSDPALEALTL